MRSKLSKNFWGWACLAICLVKYRQSQPEGAYKQKKTYKQKKRVHFFLWLYVTLFLLCLSICACTHTLLLMASFYSLPFSYFRCLPSVVFDRRLFCQWADHFLWNRLGLGSVERILLLPQNRRNENSPLGLHLIMMGIVPATSHHVDSTSYISSWCG